VPPQPLDYPAVLSMLQAWLNRHVLAGVAGVGGRTLVTWDGVLKSGRDTAMPFRNAETLTLILGDVTIFVDPDHFTSAVLTTEPRHELHATFGNVVLTIAGPAPTPPSAA
jgi:hypothetical protein